MCQRPIQSQPRSSRLWAFRRIVPSARTVDPFHSEQGERPSRCARASLRSGRRALAERVPHGSKPAASSIGPHDRRSPVTCRRLRSEWIPTALTGQTGWLEAVLSLHLERPRPEGPRSLNAASGTNGHHRPRAFLGSACSGDSVSGLPVTRRRPDGIALWAGRVGSRRKPKAPASSSTRSAWAWASGVTTGCDASSTPEVGRA